MKIRVVFVVPDDEAALLKKLPPEKMSDVLESCFINGGYGIRSALDCHFARLAEKKSGKWELKISRRGYMKAAETYTGRKLFGNIAERIGLLESQGKLD